jgi:hypothetical protein
MIVVLSASAPASLNMRTLVRKSLHLISIVATLLGLTSPCCSEELQFSELLKTPAYQQVLQRKGFTAVIGKAKAVRVLRAFYPSSKARMPWAHISLEVEAAMTGDAKLGETINVLGFNVLFLGPSGQPAQVQYDATGYIFPNDTLLAFLLPLPETEHKFLPNEMRSFYLCKAFWLVDIGQDGSVRLLETRGVKQLGDWKALDENHLYEAFSRPQTVQLNTSSKSKIAELVTRSRHEAQENSSAKSQK